MIDGTMKYIIIVVGAILSILAPIKILAIIFIIFTLIDYILGVIVGIRVRKEGFISSKSYKTIWKLIGGLTCILLAFLLDNYVLTFLSLSILPYIITGILCGSDFWSILTNFALLSDHPVFRLIKKFGKEEIKKKYNINVEELDKKEKELKDIKNRTKKIKLK
jgi:membrane protein implicated in regulation of membrane protease activity